MRTLIIDNYDSFTHNLAHYLAEVTGVLPVVVRNDEPGWTMADLDAFHNVVISPGPGHPGRSADFGMCEEVIRSGRLPLLGICLGHQGICTVHGGHVAAAPELFHGRQSAVVHGGADILAGVPSPFSAVRYHSLAAVTLPPDIEPTAWTRDGTVMALRHRSRPMWGVQFHPESACSEYGHQILRNFTALTRKWWADRQPRRRSVVTAVRPHRNGDTRARLRVISRRLAMDVSAERVFATLYRGSKHSFWLDSSGGGRFSFMGDARGPLSRVVQFDVWNELITVESHGVRRIEKGSFFDWIAADLAGHRIEVPELPFDFMLGWVGYLGYELKAECGGDKVHQSPHPDAAMIFADRALVFDHERRELHLLVLTDPCADTAARSWLDQTESALARLSRTRQEPGNTVAARYALSELSARHERGRYLELIAECQRQIAAGESYEICLTNMVEAEGSLDAWSSYQLLRAANPVPFGALLTIDELSVLSCSPERFLRIGADRTVESSPIKGTRPRSPDPVTDELLAQSLRMSVKDRAENLMIVDLVRNDLSTQAEVGSVRVDRLFAVERYSTVHQLVSTVRARLRPDCDAVDCVRAAFPGGSMTGAPKVRTMQIIDRLEQGPRGVYSGALGYFSLSGAADFSIVIRTMLLHRAGIEFGVGGAITALSEPVAEFDETVTKAAPMLRLLDVAFPGTADDVYAGRDARRCAT